MAETITVLEALEIVSERLQLATEEVFYASQAYDRAEETWLTEFDKVAAVVEQEYADKGRKTSPSEHVLERRTRGQHPTLFYDWRRAKRRAEKSQIASANRRQQVSAFQTMLNNLGAEAKVQPSLVQRIREPDDR